MDKIPVTVILPVRNEEANLPHCLDLLRDFDQVIAVDSRSVDRTPQIVREAGAELVDYVWDGKFPKKRNWALRNLDIRNDWVFFVDADEFLTPEFLAEIRQCIRDEHIQAYWVPYTVHFLGRRLRFGDPLNKISLLRKGSGEYRYTDEQGWGGGMDIEVHDHPIIRGTVGWMHHKILHNDFKGIERYLERHEAYAAWEASRYMQVMADRHQPLTRRQRIKYTLLETGLTPFTFFIGSYFLKLGLLDGKYGFLYAWYKAKYFRNVQRKIKALKSSARS